VQASVGGVTTDVIPKRIAHFERRMKYHKDEFDKRSKEEKLGANIPSGFSHF
jgi:hypothetical protein